MIKLLDKKYLLAYSKVCKRVHVVTMLQKIHAHVIRMQFVWGNETISKRHISDETPGRVSPPLCTLILLLFEDLLLSDARLKLL